MAKKVVVFGSFVADMTGRGPKFPVAGETVLGSAFKVGPGGKGSNQAVAAHRAGADVCFITKLGADTFGQMARSFYEAEGMDTRYLLIDPEASTGGALIMVNEQTAQNEIMVILGACNQFSDADLESRREKIESADILLLQMETNPDALEKVIRMAYEKGVRMVLNPAPARPIADELLGMIDTVTPNETEAFTLTGVKVENKEDAHRAAQVFLSKGVKNVVITLGEHGVYVTDGAREELYERITVMAVDTTGAGDAFNGGFVMALSMGKDLFEAARFGNCTGALSVTKIGTAPAMPTREEIEALYQKQYC